MSREKVGLVVDLNCLKILDLKVETIIKLHWKDRFKKQTIPSDFWNS